MCVDHDGQIDRVLDRADEVIGGLRAHDAGHVLDADRAHAHGDQLLDDLDVLLARVDGAGGVGNGAGSDRAGLDRLLDRHLEVVGIVQGVEDTDDVDAVANTGTHETAHDIVGIVLVAQNVLAAQQHLQLGVGHGGADAAQALPGVLVQIAEADVKGSAAPALHGVEARLVDRPQDRLELLIAHSGGDQGLTGIAQNGFGKLYFFHGISFFPITRIDHTCLR